MTQKKILLVTCWFPHEQNPQRGSFVLDHALSLAKSGTHVRILFINIRKGNKRLDIKEIKYLKNDIPVFEVNITSRFWKFLYQWPLLLKQKVLSFSARRFISDADLIHSHALFPAGFFGFQLAKKLKKPFVLTEHWTRAVSFLKKHPLGFYGKKVYQNAEAVIFVSKDLQNKIENKVHIKNSFVVANPIDGSLFHFQEKPTAPPFRFTLAAIWKKKGVKRGDLILEAFHQIQRETTLDFQLNYIGAGTALEEYKQKAEEYNLPVCFCGFEMKEKLAKHFQESHFFLHPTELETFGIVVFEALKTGTPVIASRLQVFEPYINNDNGILVDNTVEDWKTAILQAIKKNYSYKKIASAFEHPFSEKEIADSTNHIYDLVLGKKVDNSKNQTRK